MITYFHALLLGLLQGASELFPISSLGHSIILPALLGWKLGANSNQFLTFLVATHLATALVLLYVYRSDWLRIIHGLGQSLKYREVTENNSAGLLGWLLIAGTIPAGLIGLLFEQPIRALFTSPKAAAVFLILNGGFLFGAEQLRQRAEMNGKTDDQTLTKLGWLRSIGIGAAQALALFPGLSRSGASMAGSLLAGLSNEAALRFSLLLATPIIFAAALLKLPELALVENAGLRGPALIGALAAGTSAWFAVHFLERFFKNNRLLPFAFYCVIAGILSLTILQVLHR